MSFIVLYFAEQPASGYVFTRESTIPFVPVTGMMLDVDGLCFAEVTQVFWKAREPHNLEVWLQPDDEHDPDVMVGNCWEVYDQPAEPPPAVVRKPSRKAKKA